MLFDDQPQITLIYKIFLSGVHFPGSKRMITQENLLCLEYIWQILLIIIWNNSLLKNFLWNHTQHNSYIKTAYVMNTQVSISRILSVPSVEKNIANPNLPVCNTYPVTLSLNQLLVWTTYLTYEIKYIGNTYLMLSHISSRWK